MSRSLKESPKRDKTTEKKKLKLMRYRTEQKEIERFMKHYGRLKTLGAIVSEDAETEQNQEVQEAQKEIEAEKVRLCQKAKALLEHTREIDRAIETLTDGTQALILRYRYIDGLDWEEITEELCYSARSVHYIHNKALEALVL